VAREALTTAATIGTGSVISAVAKSPKLVKMGEGLVRLAQRVGSVVPAPVANGAAFIACDLVVPAARMAAMGSQPVFLSNQVMSVGKGLLLAWKYAQEGKDEDAARALVKVGFGSIGLRQGVRNTVALGNLLRKEGLVGLWQKLKACFAAGTKLWTPEGPRAIETLREGDLVLSRDENDPTGAVVARRVEMTFQRLGRILTLQVGDRLARLSEREDTAACAVAGAPLQRVD
jgi:hypothetical protein